jgi:hypothetical protein
VIAIFLVLAFNQNGMRMTAAARQALQACCFPADALNHPPSDKRIWHVGICIA